MSIRTFTLVTAVALASSLASLLALLFWREAGPWPLLVGPGLLVLLLAYLVLAASGTTTTRWQVRYHIEPGSQANLALLEQVLHYLADRAGHAVVEAGAEGLFLVAPQALDRYIPVQLTRALPEAKITRVEGGRSNNDSNSKGQACYLALDSCTPEALAWAMRDTGRRVFLHVHRGPYATLTAETEGPQPPGYWLRVPVPRPLLGLWRNLPLWNELSAGIELNSLFPPTGPDAVHSSRSRLFRLRPPDGYQANPQGRHLGRITNAGPLTLDYALPLLCIGAPPSYLVRQAVQDLERGYAVVVLSPQRRTLERIARRTEQPRTYWIDQDKSLAATTTHVAIAARQEWSAFDLETITAVTRAFLTGAGVDLRLPVTRKVVEPLIHILAASAQLTDHDFPFVDLYAVSQSVQALRAFLGDLQEHFQAGEQAILGHVTQLQALLDEDTGYVQAVTALAQVRSRLEPLKAGPLHNLSQPSFANLHEVLQAGSLILAPMTNTEFPRHNRLLGAMLDLVLHRSLVTSKGLRLALYLDEPQAYRDDLGRRWLTRCQENEALTLVLNTQAQDLLSQRIGQSDLPGGKLIFRCAAAQARSLVEQWELSCSPTDLAELPDDAALALLPGLLAALETPQGDQ